MLPSRFLGHLGWPREQSTVHGLILFPEVREVRNLEAHVAQSLGGRMR